MTSVKTARSMVRSRWPSGIPPRKQKKHTDPDSGYLVREDKSKGFFHLDHRTVDGKCAIIADTFVTPGNAHYGWSYLARLDRQRGRFGFKIQAAGLDAGYVTPHICKGLTEHTVHGVIGYSRPTHREGYLRKKDFTYDEADNCYLCPQNQMRSGLGNHSTRDAELCRLRNP